MSKFSSQIVAIADAVQRRAGQACVKRDVRGDSWNMRYWLCERLMDAKKTAADAALNGRVCHFWQNRARLVSAVLLKQLWGKAIPGSAIV
tara:strand:+ start:522 stop:791 length:270 start_codon:yes stop_codon:yes gene_type:complete